MRTPHACINRNGPVCRLSRPCPIRHLLHHRTTSIRSRCVMLLDVLWPRLLRGRVKCMVICLRTGMVLPCLQSPLPESRMHRYGAEARCSQTLLALQEGGEGKRKHPFLSFLLHLSHGRVRACLFPPVESFFSRRSWWTGLKRETHVHCEPATLLVHLRRADRSTDLKAIAWSNPPYTAVFTGVFFFLGASHIHKNCLTRK